MIDRPRLRQRQATETLRPHLSCHMATCARRLTCSNDRCCPDLVAPAHPHPPAHPAWTDQRCEGIATMSRNPNRGRDYRRCACRDAGGRRPAPAVRSSPTAATAAEPFAVGLQAVTFAELGGHVRARQQGLANLQLNAHQIVSEMRRIDTNDMTVSESTDVDR
jgi:hypothetical protein